jgi:hypothetical protein
VTQSPELAGGAGFTFADQVAARYLGGLLAEAGGPGLAERVVSRVALEQRDAGEPLDDIIVDARAPDGSIARLSLQCKRELVISDAASNTDFRVIIREAWVTLDKTDFRNRVDRVGAATGPSTAAGKSRTLQALAELARASATPAEFASRFARGGSASREQKTVLQDLQKITTDLGRPAAADDLHRLLGHFVLIRFDALHEGATEDAATIELAGRALQPDAANQAVTLFNRLQTLARQGAGRARVWDVATLRRDIAPWFPLSIARSLVADIERLTSEARLAAQSIADRIGDVAIARPAILRQVDQALGRRSLVTLQGLPGSGKSVLLRRQVEAALTGGPALLLKSDRLAGASWAQYATQLGLGNVDPVPLLAEIAATATPILFIDGLDRIDRAQRGIVTDLFRAIESSPLLAGWKVVATLRDSGIEPVRTWLPQLLDGGRVASVRIDALDDADASDLAAARPELRPLLFGPEPVRTLVRRPFFAKILDDADIREGDVPRSETALLNRWWRRGGFDAEGSAARMRQRALLRLVRLRALRPDVPIALDDLDDALLPIVEQLVVDCVLEEAGSPHFVRFAHDIFFEWSFAQLLASAGDGWIETLRDAGEPPVIGRAVELHGQASFLADGARWRTTLEALNDPRLRSQWRRVWLLAPLGCEEFLHHTEAYDAAMLVDEHALLRQALVWFQAQHTMPNANILDGTLGEFSDRGERLQFADLLGWPNDLRLWMRFLNYLDERLSALPVRLLPHVLTLFEVWQNAVVDRTNPVSAQIIERVAGWLDLLERRREDFGRFRQRDRDAEAADPWNSLKNQDEFQSALRRMLIRSARVEPDRVARYLSQFGKDRPSGREQFDAIIGFSPLLSHTHPADLAEFTLRYLRRELPEDHRRRRLEEDRRAAEHRAELRRKPETERSWSDEMTLTSPNLGYWGPDRWDWEALSLERDPSSYFPASPLHEPFHSLFAHAPDEALRLVTAMTNHAVEAWRQLHRLQPDHGTPIPIRVEFPWETQEFWGGRREYLWSRGLWAPKPLASAYLALDAWALDQVDAGVDADTLIERVVTGNKSIAILGVALRIAMAKWTVSAVSEALIVTQRLWKADIERFVQETSIRSSSLIGFTRASQRESARAVQAHNERPVRSEEIRNLVTLHVLNADEAPAERVRNAILAFADAPAFEFEEERAHLEAVAEYRDQARTNAAWGNLDHYRLIDVPDQPDRQAIVMVNPIAEEPEAKARLAESSSYLSAFTLFHWADKSFEQGALAESISLDQALTGATALDRPDLFQPGQDDDRLSITRGAVAGVAAAVVAFAPGEDRGWAVDVLARAADLAEESGPLWFAGSQIAWHQAVFVARAAAADLRRNPDDQANTRQLLALIAHPLECVGLEATAQIIGLWTVAPRLAWEGLRLALQLCISEPDDRAGSVHDPKVNVEGRNRRLGAALNALSAEPAPLPVQPDPWVRSETPRRRGRAATEIEEADLWRRPEGWWDSARASNILKLVPLAAVIPDPTYGPLLVGHCEAMLAWTIERNAPAWAEDKRDLGNSSDDYEWTHRFADLLGRLVGIIEPTSADATYLKPICALSDDPCFALLAPLTTTFMCEHVLDAEVPAPLTTVLLDRALDRVLAARPFKRGGYRAGELNGFDLPQLVQWLMFVGVEKATLACRFSNGDWSDIARILPTVNRFVRAVGWAPTIMSHYLTLVERAGTHFPADAFADAILDSLSATSDPGARWRGTIIAARIAARVQDVADHASPLELGLGQKLLRILDLLVDQGDRRSAALQIGPTFRDLRLPTAKGS